VDNRWFWRDLSVLTSGKGSNPFDARVDFLSVVMQPRADRWKKMGLINDPDTVAAEKPDKYGLMIDHMKDGSLTWDPEVFGFSSGVIGLQLFLNKKFDASKWSAKKYVESRAPAKHRVSPATSSIIQFSSTPFTASGNV